MHYSLSRESRRELGTVTDDRVSSKAGVRVGGQRRPLCMDTSSQRAAAAS